MKVVGIVAEYNPFHSGHFSHLQRSKEISGSDIIVVVMSGNFVQRGEPALWDKWRRAKIALHAGADLVVELPLSLATASAGHFARGAVTLLDKMGIVDSICFGSECGDINELSGYAAALFEENADFKDRIKEYLRKGLSYPAARSKASTDVALPDTPNNVLGVEYLLALMELNSKIRPFTVPRSPGSAKEIRDALKTKANAGSHMENYADLDNLSSIFHYILHTDPNLDKYLDVSEGLENRLIKCAKHNRLISDIIAAAKTKRYTYLRLQRAVLHIILGITKAQEPEYIRVLGFREESGFLLKMLEEVADLPIVTNIKNANFSSLDDEIRSTKIYSLAFADFVYFNEYAMPIVKIPAK